MKLKHPEPKQTSAIVLLDDITEEMHPRDKLHSRQEEQVDHQDLMSMVEERYWYQKTLVNVIQISKKQSQDASGSCVLKNARRTKCDKNSGLRLAGMDEVLKRIIGKVAILTLLEEIIDSVGSLSSSSCNNKCIWTWRFGGCSNNWCYERFQFCEQNIFLHYIRIICPFLSNYVYNCYSSPTKLFIIGDTQSSTDLTHGDPATVVIIAISIIPMILMLVQNISNIPKNKNQISNICW